MFRHLRHLLVSTLLLSATSLEAAFEFRTIDGSGNNLIHTDYGQVGQPLMRHHSANYMDGIGGVDASRPNPRVISNTLFQQTESRPDPRGLSNMIWAWGQFVDHDITHSLIGSANGTLRITIPTGDPSFDNGIVNLAGQSIQVTRSNYTSGSGITTPREQVNDITAWLDASMVYGGRDIDGPAGVDRATYLRTGAGGKLKATPTATMGDMLPKYIDGISPEMDNTHRSTMTGQAYVAGDVRANENPALLSLQTLFMREHNRVAELVAGCDTALSDDDIYQRARKIVGAEIQAITYHEYLPALGVDVGSYGGYDPQIDPSISNEFANAAFRLGHSQVGSMIPRLDENGTPIPQGPLDLANSFFNPGMMLDGGLEPILRGLAATTQESTDAQMIGELRNQLFQTFIPGVGLVDNATDLASMNIMRGRDHGLGTYNQTRAALGLEIATSFDDISSDVDIRNALATVYPSVDDVDLYPGLLSEDHLPDASLGETLAQILGDQFTRLRDGDRFWFENNQEGVNNDLLCTVTWDGTTLRTAEDWLDSLRLSDIIQLNTEIGDIRGNVFVVPEPASMSLLMLGFLLTVRRRKHR